MPTGDVSDVRNPADVRMVSPQPCHPREREGWDNTPPTLSRNVPETGKNNVGTDVWNLSPPPGKADRSPGNSCSD